MESLVPHLPWQADRRFEAPGRSLTPHHHCMMKALPLHRFTAADAWPRAEGRELDQMVQAELTQ